MGIDWSFRISDLLLFGTAGITVLVGYIRMQTAVGTARETAEEAIQAAAKASQEAREVSASVAGKLEIIKTQLSDFRVEVAEKYTARHDIVALEERLLTAVERLTDRVDQLLQRRP